MNYFFQIAKLKLIELNCSIVIKKTLFLLGLRTVSVVNILISIVEKEFTIKIGVRGSHWSDI